MALNHMCLTINLYTGTGIPPQALTYIIEGSSHLDSFYFSLI